MKADEKLYRLPPGTVLDDRYVLEDVLGEGGFGITYIGRNRRVGIPVAIKEYFCRDYMERDVSESNEIRLPDAADVVRLAAEKRKFLKEARSIGDFAGEDSVVGVSDYFEENGTAYIIMEYVQGITLDALAEHIQGMDGTISEDLRQMMAKKAGNSIRLIKSYVQSCLMTASQRERRGGELSRDDVVRIALQKWPNGQHIITIEQIQRTIESFYDISHEDLIGSKRNKELMEPRHVAIWLSRDKTDETLADIGKRFGNRSHATVKHSIAWVEDKKAASRTFGETLDRLISDLNDAD